MIGEPVYSLPELFKQLGLSDDPADMEAFIQQHELADEQVLHEADFWTPQQANFLREGLMEDSNWSDAIDELNVLLRA